MTTGQGLPMSKYFLPMQAAMFARRDVKRHRVFSLEHDTISSGIDPTLFRILGDHQIVGADVAAAVQLMPARELETLRDRYFFRRDFRKSARL